jgi:hypothetical protein
MKPRIFTTAFSKVYPMYIQKAEKKGRTKEEVDTVICWLTGYDEHRFGAFHMCLVRWSRVVCMSAAKGTARTTSFPLRG